MSYQIEPNLSLKLTQFLGLIIVRTSYYYTRSMLLHKSFPDLFFKMSIDGYIFDKTHRILQVQITFSLHRGDKLLRIGEMYEITAF